MTDKLKKQIILNLPYLIFVYLFDKLCQGIRLAPGADASEKLLHIGQGFSAAFASLAPSFHLLDLCMGAAGAVLIRLAVYSKGKNAKKYRRGIEYGSARWGDVYKRQVLVAITFTRFLADLMLGISHTSFMSYKADIMIPREREKSKLFFKYPGVFPWFPGAWGGCHAPAGCAAAPLGGRWPGGPGSKSPGRQAPVSYTHLDVYKRQVENRLLL